MCQMHFSLGWNLKNDTAQPFKREVELKKHTLKSRLLLSAAATVIGLGAVTAAQAQEANADGSDVVVVTGQRKAIQSAQDIKKKSDQIVDSITAVDIGALPDRSVTEALQRVSGVTIGRTSENRDVDRLNIEGSGVQIRGLTWVRSELNGRDSFGAKNGRQLGWEDVTPELMAGVDVYKNPSAEIVEGGLGGTVNLRTWMPFDTKGQKFAFSLDSTIGSLRQERTPSYSVLYSNRFQTGIGEIGILVDVAHSELKSRIDSIMIDPYNTHSDSTYSSYDGGTTANYSGDNSIDGQPLDNVMVPVGVEWRLQHRDKTRDGAYAALQWRPNDSTEVYLTYFESKATLINADRFAQTSACCSAATNQSFLVGPASGTTLTYDANGNATSGWLIDNGGGGNGVANSMLMSVGTRYGVDHNRTTDISTGAKWHGDRLSLSADFQYVDSEKDGVDFTVYNTVTATGGVYFNTSSDVPVIQMGDLTADTSIFNLYAAMDHIDDSDARQYTVKLDGAYDFDSDFWKSVKFGARATSRYSTQRDGGYNWALISAPWAMSQTATVERYSNHQEIVSFDNFFGGAASVPSLWMPTMDLAQSRADTLTYLDAIRNGDIMPSTTPAHAWGDYGSWTASGNGKLPDWAAYGAGDYSPFVEGSLYSYVQIWANPLNKSSVNMWTPLTGDYGIGSLNLTGTGINRQTESTEALYGTVRFGSDTFFGYGMEWDGNAGVRVVTTKTAAQGVGTFGSIGSSQYQYAATEEVLAKMLFADGSTSDTVGGNEYTNVLPSLNLRFKPREDIAIRFAAAKSIVRPDFYQLSATVNASPTLQTALLTAAKATELGIINEETGAVWTAEDIAAATTAPTYVTDVAFSFYSGNPNLKPMRADSFDISAEWYIKPGAMLAVALFDKEVYDYIQSVSATTTLTKADGSSINATGTIPMNFGHGRVYGFEIQHQQFYDNLPGIFSGLGTEVNFTYLESIGSRNVSSSVFDSFQVNASKQELPLENMSRYSYNATLMYNKYGIDARLAYNWRSRYLMSAAASNLQVPAYMADYGQLDASIMYTLNKNYKVGLQVANVTKTKTIIEIDERDSYYYGTQGNFSESLIYKHNWSLADRRITMVLRGTF